MDYHCQDPATVTRALRALHRIYVAFGPQCFDCVCRLLFMANKWSSNYYGGISELSFPFQNYDCSAIGLPCIASFLRNPIPIQLLLKSSLVYTAMPLPFHSSFIALHLLSFPCPAVVTRARSSNCGYLCHFLSCRRSPTHPWSSCLASRQ